MLKNIAIISGVAATLAMSNGLNTNNNQSAAYLRNVAHYATLGNDAPLYNPAGTAFMKDGWHISLNSQAFWQTRGTNATSPLWGGEKRFEGDAQIPCMPSLFATWHRGNLAISGYFGIIGGGGTLNNDDGLPSFEASVAKIPMLLSQNGLETSAYSVDMSLDATSYIFGLGLGAAYKINDMLSLYLGARINYSYAHYEGELKNIQVNPKNKQLGLDGSMVHAAVTFSEMSETFAEYATQAENAAKLYASKGDKATAAEYEAKADAFSQKSQTFAGIAQSVSDKELDVKQNGWGITPIAALSFKYKRITLGVKFEYNTSIEVENDTKVNEVGLSQYDDGVKNDNDIPASIFAGLTYSVLDNARICLGYGHWFDSHADLPNDLEDYVEDSNEFLYGIEIDFFKRWTISGGVQVTRYHLSDEYMSDMNIFLDNTTFGFGAAFKAFDWLKLNVAYFHSIYNDWDEKLDYGEFTYKRTNRGVGIGAELDF